MKRALLILLAAAPLSVLADSPDSTFYKKATEGGISEIEAGKLAQDKGSSQAVKDFGAMMVKDHTAAGDKLKTIAAAKNVDLPTTSSVGQMATKTKLEVLSGDTFDKSYIKGQIKAHKDTAALLRKETASGQDDEAKAWAKATLPAVQSHLKQIEKIAADAGVDTK